MRLWEGERWVGVEDFIDPGVPEPFNVKTDSELVRSYSYMPSRGVVTKGDKRPLMAIFFMN